MRIIAHSPLAPSAALGRLGEVEYSYAFVLRAFRPAMRAIGELIEIADPGEADALMAGRDDAVLLSFTPPHLTRVAVGGPTVPVFAWEFDSLPTDSWYDDPKNDWRTTLAQCRGAIVHSRFTAEVVRKTMGEAYPVAALPAPVWDDFAGQSAPKRQKAVLHLGQAVVIDTHDPETRTAIPDDVSIAGHLDEWRLAERGVEKPIAPDRRLGPTVSRHFARWRAQAAADIAPGRLQRAFDAVEARLTNRHPALRLKRRRVELSGVVFTSVFNPRDGRKNWMDMLTAFREAFAEIEDATLVFKLSHTDFVGPLQHMLVWLGRLPPFRCRIVIVAAALEDDHYRRLIGATDFAVNASNGEGQCLPLMEFLSAGVPAIAPDHTGMADYIDDEVAFVLPSWNDVNVWPHDPRHAFRTLRRQTDWKTLVEAYRAAYAMAKSDPAGYAAMGEAATRRLERHCSRAVVADGLGAFLRSVGLR